MILSEGVNRYVFIDDVHLIASHLVSSDLLRWSARIPPDVRIVIAGRHDPFRTFGALRASGQLTEIHGDELSFTREETEDLLQVLDSNSPARASTRSFAAPADGRPA